MAVILISACLVGVNCKYNGGNNKLKNLGLLQKQHTLVPACPEQLGGLLTPREKAEISRETQRILNETGKDVTSSFNKGAGEFLYLAELFSAEAVILKDKSPSCGVDFIYDGTFQNRLIKGQGITTRLLLNKKFRIFSETSFSEFLLK